MNDIYRLSDILPGQFAKIIRLDPLGNMIRRLEDLGFIAGTTVECVLKSPLGDPTAFLVRGAIIALRKEDSRFIEVRVV